MYAKIIWFNKNKGFGQLEVIDGKYEGAILFIHENLFKNIPKRGKIVKVTVKRDFEDILQVFKVS